MGFPKFCLKTKIVIFQSGKNEAETWLVGYLDHWAEKPLESDNSEGRKKLRIFQPKKIRNLFDLNNLFRINQK
jgi:hypothetical protein